MAIHQDKQRSRAAWGKYLGLSGLFLGSMAIMIIIGQWLDRKTGTAIPWFSIFLPVLSVIGVIYQLYKETTNDRKKE